MGRQGKPVRGREKEGVEKQQKELHCGSATISHSSSAQRRSSPAHRFRSPVPALVFRILSTMRFFNTVWTSMQLFAPVEPGDADAPPVPLREPRRKPQSGPQSMPAGAPDPCHSCRRRRQTRGRRRACPSCRRHRCSASPRQPALRRSVCLSALALRGGRGHWSGPRCQARAWSPVARHCENSVSAGPESRRRWWASKKVAPTFGKPNIMAQGGLARAPVGFQKRPSRAAGKNTEYNIAHAGGGSAAPCCCRCGAPSPLRAPRSRPAHAAAAGHEISLGTDLRLHRNASGESEGPPWLSPWLSG